MAQGFARGSVRVLMADLPGGLGPVSPCAICLNECNPEGAFTWPCHHSFHPDCVSRLHARTPRPDCPLCRTPWSVETDRQFRNVCTPCGEPEPPAEPSGRAQRQPPREAEVWAPDLPVGTTASVLPERLRFSCDSLIRRFADGATLEQRAAELQDEVSWWRG